MSLFGENSDEGKPTQVEQKSLFDDESAPAPKSHSSLFDDNGDGTDSPWTMPTPKKTARSELVKTLLPASAVPDSYIDAYDVLLESEFKAASGTIGIDGARKLLESGGVESSQQGRILKLVTDGQDNANGFGRNELNVLLALIGLSQEQEEVSLDGVDERRGSKCIHIVSTANE